MKQAAKYYSLAQEGRTAELQIYGDVTSWPWLESDVSAYNLSKQLQELDVDEITVGINSYGGEVAEGLAIANALRNHKAKVTTRVDGFACSIASVIFAAGDERIMNECSLVMIHNAWSYAQGDANALRKAADDLETVNEASIKAYMAVCDVEEDELRAMMDEEKWLTPDDALDMGLATSVLKVKTEKASQNARKKVYDMLVNPYQLEDEDENPDGTEDPETQEEPETTEEPETEEEPEADPEEDPDETEQANQKAAAFFAALAN